MFIDHTGLGKTCLFSLLSSSKPSSSALSTNLRGSARLRESGVRSRSLYTMPPIVHCVRHAQVRTRPRPKAVAVDSGPDDCAGVPQHSGLRYEEARSRTDTTWQIAMRRFGCHIPLPLPHQSGVRITSATNDRNCLPLLSSCIRERTLPASDSCPPRRTRDFGISLRLWL